eukprot:TRINITY_DN3990_c0_g1_i1.p6 TRINITY_DN3990_c0_g1~~TRINITY_DN3990_c0_g1_i1.p6  ORF type:complete len:232 (+),score=12.08 TRINITY_DN3990_c0_g1_i1:306-1001(+)
MLLNAKYRRKRIISLNDCRTSNRIFVVFVSYFRPSTTLTHFISIYPLVKIKNSNQANGCFNDQNWSLFRCNFEFCIDFWEYRLYVFSNERCNDSEVCTVCHHLNGDVMTMKFKRWGYDTVTCLSVLKWIHHHHGDQGVKQLFQYVFSILDNDGFFILEPQPWKSYSRSFKDMKLMKELPFNRANQYEFRPDQFQSFLVDSVGFIFVEKLQTKNVAKGFDREILVFQKPQNV